MLLSFWLRTALPGNVPGNSSHRVLQICDIPGAGTRAQRCGYPGHAGLVLREAVARGAAAYTGNQTSPRSALHPIPVFWLLCSSFLLFWFHHLHFGATRHRARRPLLPGTCARHLGETQHRPLRHAQDRRDLATARRAYVSSLQRLVVAFEVLVKHHGFRFLRVGGTCSPMPLRCVDAMDTRLV